MIAALAASLLFAASITCGHRATHIFGGAHANFWRLLLATILLGVWSYLWGMGLRGAGAAYFFVSGLIGFGLGDVALYQALPRLGSRLAMVFTQCLAAPFGVIIERVWLGTQLTWQQLVCVGIILGGVALALAPHESQPRSRSDWRWGTCYGIAAALGGALGAVFSRRAFQALADAGQSIDGANAAFQRIVAGLLVAGVFLWFIRWQPRRGGAPWVKDGGGHGAEHASAARSWLWIWGNALAGPTLGVSCMQWALRTTPTGIVLAVIALTPLLVIPLARFMEAEKPTARSLVGSLLAVLGVVGLALVKYR
jgi:drug/metabolite transporter (DMT)-like permease